MNKWIGLGRLTRDPEVRYTQSGKCVTSFTLACSRPHKADQQQQADFMPCVAWEKLGEIAGNHLVKGSQVLIEGRIQTRSYDAQDGSKRYVTECIVRDIEFAGSKPQGQAQPQDSGAGSFGSEVLPDEEIPF